MKDYILLIIAFLGFLNSKAQDTIKSNNGIVKEEIFRYKKLILPASAIAVGGILKSPSLQIDIQRSVRNTFGEDFHTKADDYIQFLPAAQILGGNLLGFKSKHGYKQMATNLLVSNLMATGVTFLGKTSFKDLRPDGSANNSFPSGHTTSAFNHATLLFFEYKDSNIWYASSGYLFAASTGILRIANNRHWSGDVLAGAGIGIAIGTIVSYWNPFHFDKKSKGVGLIGYPVINDKNYGIGLVYQFK
jgi:PAP2 superfamily